MAAGEIDLTMSGDPKALLRAFNSIDKKIGKMEKGLRGVSRQSKKATGDLSSGMEVSGRHAMRFVGSLAGIGSAAAGVYAIARQLKAEYQHIVSRQRLAGQTQLTVGEARGQALYNLPAGFAPERLEQMIQTASRTHNIRQEAIWRGVGGPLSAMGSLSPKQFADVLDQAVRAHKAGGMDISELAGGGMDVMRVTGTGSRAALGWMRQVGQQMRVTTLPEQIRSVVPVIGAAKQFGWTPETGAELGAYFTQFASDVTGRKASTGAINFMQALQDAMTKSKALIPEYETDAWTGKQKLKFRTLTAKTGPGRLGELQNWYGTASEELRREFVGKMPGEAKIKGAILALIAQDPKAMEAYEQAKRAINAPTAVGIGDNWGAWFTDVAKGKQEPVRNVGKLLDQFIEGRQLHDPGAMAGVVREKLAQAMAAIPGVRDVDIKLAKAGFELQTGFGRQDVIGAAIDRIRTIQGRSGYGMPYYRETSAGWGREWVEEVPSGKGPWEGYRRNPDYRPEQGQALDDLIERFEAIEKVLEKIAGTANKMAKAGDGKAPLQVEVVRDSRPAPAVVSPE